MAPADALPADNAGMKDLVDMVAAMQKEIKALREQLEEQPTAGQVEKLQQQLRMQHQEMGSMREKMDKMQQQIDSMSGRSSEIASMKQGSTVVSAEVLPLHSLTGNSRAPDLMPVPIPNPKQVLFAPWFICVSCSWIGNGAL